MTAGRSVYHIPSELARSEALAAPCSQVSAQSPSPGQIQAVPVGDNLTRLGAPYVFAKIPNPVQKMFEKLPVTDVLQVSSLIIFLRVLVRMQYMSPAFGISTPQLLQIFYGHTKRFLASKTIAAIHRGDTLEA
jgi:hypothetical protein